MSATSDAKSENASVKFYSDTLLHRDSTIVKVIKTDSVHLIIRDHFVTTDRAVAKAEKDTVFIEKTNTVTVKEKDRNYIAYVALSLFIIFAMYVVKKVG